MLYFLIKWSLSKHFTFRYTPSRNVNFSSENVIKQPNSLGRVRDDQESPVPESSGLSTTQKKKMLLENIEGKFDSTTVKTGYKNIVG